MANENLIKIIPKEKPETPKSVKVSFIVSVVLLIILISFGVTFKVINSKMEKEKVKLGRELATFEAKKWERDLMLKAEKINSFSFLLARHTIASNFFDFLKKFCHKEVQFSGMNLNLSEHMVQLTGLADNYTALSQQILIFRKAKEIQGLKISDVNLDREGKVNFNISLVFSPNLIKEDVK